jgi:pimeloyl-ACP methyl ester carboxylesterase
MAEQAPGLGRSELREGYAVIGDVRLHYVEAGDGPLIVLLHGFPEFRYGWRLQIEPLATAGFRSWRRPPGVYARGDRSVRRGVVAARGSKGNDQLLPVLGAAVAEARRSATAPNLGAHPGHLGKGDRYLGPELAEPNHDDVPNLDRVERLSGASHWVHHDEPKRVTQLLIDFFAPALPAENR